MPPADPNTRVILESVIALVERQVQLHLPEGKRGYRAVPAVRRRVAPLVEEALLSVVARVAAEVDAELPSLTPFAPEAPRASDLSGGTP